MGQSWDTPGDATSLRGGSEYKSGLQEEPPRGKNIQPPTTNFEHPERGKRRRAHAKAQRREDLNSQNIQQPTTNIEHPRGDPEPRTLNLEP
jgi:hypothetical protein